MIGIELERVTVGPGKYQLSDTYTVEYAETLDHEFGHIHWRKVKNILNQLSSEIRKENKAKGRPI